MHTLFTELKTKTAECHRELENTAPFSSFHRSNSIDVIQYSAVLQTMCQFHQDVTAYLTSQPNSAGLRALNIDSMLPFLGASQVLASLKTDRQALAQYAPQREKNRENAAITEAPFTHSISSVIAAMYVWLGSSMGANMLVRRIQNQNERISPALPVHYYGEMASKAKHWVAFKAHIDNRLAPLCQTLGVTEAQFSSWVVDDANQWFAHLIALGNQASLQPLPHEYCG